jgi:hypothetical protein
VSLEREVYRVFASANPTPRPWRCRERWVAGETNVRSLNTKRELASL